MNAKREMIPMDLNEIKSVESQILRHFADFCEKNNIRYFLSNGTLLGAVKYQGFIPWDDDVDVGLLREDYDKFIALYKDNKHYTLCEVSRSPSYDYPFAKLMDNRTYLIESDICNGIELGVYLDIFPIDNAGSNFRLAQFRAVFGRALASLLQWAKSNRKPETLVQRCQLLLSKLMSPRQWILLIEKNARRFAHREKAKYAACLVWPAYKAREVVPHEVYDDVASGCFEENWYKIAIGYDVYLRSLYGDYENDPPLELQKTHHIFEAYWLVNDSLHNEPIHTVNLTIARNGPS